MLWYILAGLIAAYTVFCLVRAYKKKGECCGNCANCARSCKKNEDDN